MEKQNPNLQQTQQKQKASDDLAQILFRNADNVEIEVSYEQILTDTQKYMIENHAKTISESSSNSADVIKNFIRQYVQLRKYKLKDMSTEDLVDNLYESMAGYAFLRKYLDSPDTEEININAWDDIEIIRSGGRAEKLNEHFMSPEHAIDIIRRMIAPTGVTLDRTTPRIYSNIGQHIRVSAAMAPLVDEAIGLTASIRIVNQRIVTSDYLLATDTCTTDMLAFLQACIRYGASVCIAGATGSGKTTIMGWLLSNVPDNRRLVTIEDGSREFNLVKKDEKGNTVNSVVHLLTRHTESENVQNINQDDLLEYTLRMHPDVIGVGEIRAARECMAVAEASRTGHTCATTIHSNSAADSYRRMMTLAKRQNNLNDNVLMEIMVEAFPIIVFTKQMEDGTRKIIEIIEAQGYKNDELQYQTLFDYHVTDNRRDPRTGSIQITGCYRRRGFISDNLCTTFLNNGITKDELLCLTCGKEEDNL